MGYGPVGAPSDDGQRGPAESLPELTFSALAGAHRRYTFSADAGGVDSDSVRRGGCKALAGFSGFVAVGVVAVVGVGLSLLGYRRVGCAASARQEAEDSYGRLGDQVPSLTAAGDRRLRRRSLMRPNGRRRRGR